MRIVVMGSGGTGGYFGAKLARAGEDVTFVARGAHLEAIRAQGLRVKSAIDGEWVVRAPAVERLAGLPPADLVLFCVKSFDTESAGEAIKPVVGPGTGVLPVQNGVDNGERLERILGPGHVMGGVAQVLATIEAPGVVSHRFLGRIIFGEMDGRRERAGAGISPGLRAGRDPGRDLLQHASGPVGKVRVDRGAGRHDGADALPGRRRPVRARDPRGCTASSSARWWRWGTRRGQGSPPRWWTDAMGMLDNLGAAFTSSLHHDLAEGKRLELEALHGHAVRLGERHGIPTPMLFAVYAALKPYADGPPQAATA